MEKINQVITREKPEEIRVLWITIDELRSFNDNESFIPVCDFCNNTIDWNPFPVVDFPSDDELADDDYIPIGGNSFCEACAKRFYGLKRSDTGIIDRLWACFGIIKVSRDKD